MSRAPVALAALLYVTGCPAGDANPERVWLATDVVETRVKLIDYEPPPF
ncbi:MAG: hypothetical protein KF773_40180 [Deltaproteobacteria bacterium]|nr:hypothetical protein [Deltaproteobacteria bacterium]MCW5804352.1 hypothetical protein [Deltaproteobacteria bacterium]